MPQLSPMLGMLVFILTNLAFTNVVMSASSLVLMSPKTVEKDTISMKEFQSFS